MKRLALCLSVLAFVILFAIPQQSALGQTLIYTSDLVDPSGWGYSHFGGTDAPIPGTDTSTAEFDWDYSLKGIPEAPNSDSGDPATRGLRLSANDTGLFGGDQIAVFHLDEAFTGQYTLQVDVWANWASNMGAGIGTTEHAGVYAGFDPVAAQASFSPSQNGAGILFDTDGDCGNCDYILTKDAAELDTFSGQYVVTDFGFGNQPGYDNTDGDLPTLFPEFDIAAATNNLNGTGTQPAGAAGFRWMTVTAEVDTDVLGNGTNGTPGTAKYTLESAGEGITIGTVDNSVDDDPNDGEDTMEQPVGMDGGIALMMVDFFGGTPQPFDLGFVLFDNVRVFDGFLTGVVDGDFNDDTAWDCTDVDALTAEIAAGTNDPAFDITSDGNVNTDDLDAWLVEGGAMNPAATGGNPFLEGDANLDGVVDVPDFNIWNGNKFTNETAWCAGNFTADNVVDVPDFNTWNANKFTSSNPGAAVPEPGGMTLVLCLAIMGGLLARRRF